MKWTNSNRTGGTTLHATDGNSGGTSTSHTTQNGGGGFITNGNGTGASDRRSIFYTNDVDSLKNGNNTKVRTHHSISVSIILPSICLCVCVTVFVLGQFVFSRQRTIYLSYVIRFSHTNRPFGAPSGHPSSSKHWERKHMAHA